jgi:two-component system, chemotaxis family, response regulator Rcp1
MLAETSAVHPSRPVEILLVEDNPHDVRLAQEFLKDLPFPCSLSVAQDGVEAWSFLTREGGLAGAPRPDLILLDLNLPTKDGREVLADIKRHPSLKAIPVLVLTSSKAEADIESSYQLQANCYLVKPIGLEPYRDLVKSIGTFWLTHAALPGSRPRRLVEAPRESPDASWSGERRDLTERILTYFRDHPTAMDSLEGIARIWVCDDPSVVARSLEELRARRLLAKRTIGGADCYSLPREQETTTMSAAELAPVLGKAADTSARTIGRILVVDDDPGCRAFLADALTHAGHIVAKAPATAQALEMLRADSFDLVLTDVVMPESSGFEVLKAVKRDSPTTEVVVITGHPNLEYALEALRHGAHDFITKPIYDLGALYRIVERALVKRGLVARKPSTSA